MITTKLALWLGMLSLWMAVATKADEAPLVPHWFAMPAVMVGERVAVAEDTAMLQAVITIGMGQEPEVLAQGLEEFIKEKPDSAWTPSLRAIVASYYQDTGRYTRAVEHYELAWEETKALKDFAGRRVADFVFAHWTRLLTSLARIETLELLFKDSASRAFLPGPMLQMTIKNHEAFALMRRFPAVSYKCGLLAMRNFGQRLYGEGFNAAALMRDTPADQAFSMQALMQVGQRHGLNLVAIDRGEDLRLAVPCIVHWKQNHYAAILSERDGLCEVADPTFGQTIYLTLEQINEEASGKFLLLATQVPAGWRRLNPAESATVFGRGVPYYTDDRYDAPCATNTTASLCPDSCRPGGVAGGNFGGMGGAFGSMGGAIGSFSPDNDSRIAEGTEAGGLGGQGPGGSGLGCEGCQPGAGSTGGMISWSVSDPYINVWLQDEPLRYNPALGEPFSVKVAYKQRETTIGNDLQMFSFGVCWNSQLLSYVDTAGTDFLRYRIAHVYLPGGGRSTFTFPAAVTEVTDYRNNCRLKYMLNSGGAVTNFVFTYTDGAQLHYSFLRTDTSGLWSQAFLAKKVDAQGFATLYNYTYSSTTRNIRLNTITDADNRSISFSYTNNIYGYSNLISRISGPFSLAANFYYDDSAQLTNITDVASISSRVTYDGFGWPETIVTPYGTTSFSYTSMGEGPLGRAVVVTDPTWQKQTFAYFGYCQHLPALDWFMPATYTIPSNLPVGTQLDNNAQYRMSFYWNATQSEGLPANLEEITTADARRARARHWLEDYSIQNQVTPDATLAFERAPSPDGTIEGIVTWYDYAGKVNGANFPGTQILPSLVARRLPDNTTWYESYQRNTWGKPTSVTETYGDGSSTRTTSFSYSTDGLDLLERRGPGNVLLEKWAYNSRHQLTNSIQYFNSTTGYTNSYAYDALYRLLTHVNPAGQTRTYTYNATDNYLSQIQDQPSGRTETYAFLNGLVRTNVDARGLTKVYTWDNLQRLSRIDYPDGYVQYSYTQNGANILDLTGFRDKLGNWTYYGYDGARRLVRMTNALQQVTAYGYCGCGGVDYLTNALGTTLQAVTHYVYNNQSRLTHLYYPDNSSVTNEYNALGQLTVRRNALGATTNYYNNQGLLTLASNAFGRVSQRLYDVFDNSTNITDAAGVSVAQTFDYLGRVLTRTYPDTGVERYGYSYFGVSNYTNQLTNVWQYQFDAAGRKTNEITPLNEQIQYGYNAASDLTSLRDGRSKFTYWGYDQYGRMTNKLDHNSATVARYTYYANGPLATRYTPAKGTTYYYYDALGSLTNVNYPATTDVTLQYDARNRLTNQVDGAGTTRYTYDGLGRLLTETNSLLANCLLTLTYPTSKAGWRGTLQLEQPSGGPWSQTYGYDAAGRLTNLAASSGTFSYTYQGASRLVQRLALPNSAAISNSYDNAARLAGTWLKNSGGTLLNKHLYTNNMASQRTKQVRFDDSYVDCTYDRDGQLESARGYTSGGTPIAAEQLGYKYDTGWNLNQRTNNGAVTSFGVDNVNQLTSGPDGSYVYDSNGNMTQSGSYHTYEYDDENRLVRITYTATFRTEFVYDTQSRLRIRRDYSWVNNAWSLSDTITYLYDGRLLLQTRSSGGVRVTYTRGPDLSGTRSGAGGIGGLLARSSTTGTTNAFYQADGNGNITAMVDGAQALAATYKYNPYGATLSSSGSLASANLMRFSSKEIHTARAIYNYGFRFYDPNLQRWLSRDPLRESGGHNLYAFNNNNPVIWTDPDGLAPQLTSVTYDQNTGSASYGYSPDYPSARPSGQIPSVDWPAAAAFFFGNPPPGFKIGMMWGPPGAGCLGKLPRTLPKTRDALHLDLRSQGFQYKSTSQRGYVTYKHADGRVVTVKPNGEVIPTSPTTSPSGKNYNQRTDYDFNRTSDQSHSSGHYVEPLDSIK